MALVPKHITVMLTKDTEDQVIAPNGIRTGLATQVLGGGPVMFTYDGSAPTRLNGFCHWPVGDPRGDPTQGTSNGIPGLGNSTDSFTGEIRGLYLGSEQNPVGDPDVCQINVIELEQE